MWQIFILVGLVDVCCQRGVENDIESHTLFEEGLGHIGDVWVECKEVGGVHVDEKKKFKEKRT